MAKKQKSQQKLKKFKYRIIVDVTGELEAVDEDDARDRAVRDASAFVGDYSFDWFVKNRGKIIVEEVS